MRTTKLRCTDPYFSFGDFMKTKIATAVGTFATALAFASNAFAGCILFICLPDGGGSAGGSPAAAPEVNATGAIPVLALLLCVGFVLFRRYRRA